MPDKLKLDRLWINARLATLDPARPGLGLMAKGCLGSRAGRIVLLADEPPPGLEATVVVDCAGRLVTPGLIDCHTHLVHGGNRAAEFEMRLAGATYEAIAKAGGGILSSVQATRAATEAELVASALPRLDALLAEGVTTVEIKSGYGLDQESETRMLRAARALGAARPVRVVTSFLGAHALPPEAAGDRDAYLDTLATTVLPALAAEGLVDAVDAFCEGIAFTPQQCARLFQVARGLGLPVKLHADQLSNGGGAALAAFRQHGVPMALATDCNPGSSPLTSLLLTMNMGATLFRMTVDECLAAVTRHAALALGLADEVGTLQVGKRCDLAIWDVERPAELVYRMGFNPLFARVWGGV